MVYKYHKIHWNQHIHSLQVLTKSIGSKIYIVSKYYKNHWNQHIHNLQAFKNPVESAYT